MSGTANIYQASAAPQTNSSAGSTAHERLVGQLQVGFGVLVAMLEERIDPGAARCRDSAKLCRQVARELGLETALRERLATLMYLYMLDRVLRKELGEPTLLDPALAFDADAPMGGLGPSLRAAAFELLADTAYEGACELLSMIAEFLDSGGSRKDAAALSRIASQFSRAEVDALSRVISSD